MRTIESELFDRKSCQPVIYDEAIQFLYDLQLFGAKFGLENTRRLASLAGNPQDNLKFIHVAGTNGKGSVCAMLESIYRSAGYRTGLYSSPHLIHFGERIRVGNKKIDDKSIIALTKRAKALLAAGAEKGWWDSINSPDDCQLGHPTFFEVVTIMAMIHFAENECDIVLWETGMGGRLDATNIVNPLASVITNISLEHSAYLGDTIEKVCAEKSGIIKPNVPVLTSVENEHALVVIRDVAKSRNCPLSIVNSVDNDLAEQLFPNSYQQQNARLAITVADALSPVLKTNETHIESGLGSFSLPCRLQSIKRGGQTILIDGAHNPASMKALRRSIENNKFPTIFGCFDDKDIEPILSELLPMVSELHLVPINSPRTAKPSEIANVVHRLTQCIPVYFHHSLGDAIRAVSDSEDVLITGSLHLAGEASGLLGNEESDTTESSLNDWRASTK